MTRTASSSPRPGLTGLSGTVLAPRREAALHDLVAGAGGGASFRARKAHEAHELFALEQLSERLEILRLDISSELRAVLRLVVPVPCRAPEGGELVVAHEALLGLVWPEELLRAPLPGTSVLQILGPRHVWLPAVSFDALQVLCLGTAIAPGTPVRELVLAAYAALSMQTVVIDERDPAGVLNADAARWWQAHMDRIPLSREPFLAPRTRTETEGDRDEETKGRTGGASDG
ncbi:MAG: hypothetical protein ACYTG2_10745 [Planctomycetota bacterium]|jgi:hypothetical protein